MRYFFDVSDGTTKTSDNEGWESGNREDAVKEAARIICEVAFHDLLKAPLLTEHATVYSAVVREGRRPITVVRLTIDTEKKE